MEVKEAEKNKKEKEIKIRAPRFYDISAIYKEDSQLTPEEYKRIIKHFIYLVESKKRIPRKLLVFIANNLKQIDQDGCIQVWTQNRDKGRPLISFPNDYLNMLAWYRFHLDPEFCNLPKSSGGGRWQAIADSFTYDNKISAQAAKLSDRDGNDPAQNKSIVGMASEASIKRAISLFQECGLFDPRLPRSSLQNEIQTEVFCRLVLGLEDIEEINAKQQQIIDCWIKNHLKS